MTNLSSLKCGGGSIPVEITLADQTTVSAAAIMVRDRSTLNDMIEIYAKASDADDFPGESVRLVRAMRDVTGLWRGVCDTSPEPTKFADKPDLMLAVGNIFSSHMPWRHVERSTPTASPSKQAHDKVNKRINRIRANIEEIHRDLAAIEEAINTLT